MNEQEKIFNAWAGILTRMESKIGTEKLYKFMQSDQNCNTLEILAKYSSLVVE